MNVVFFLESLTNFKMCNNFHFTVECSGRAQLSVEELRMRLRVHEDRTEGNVRFLQRLGARSCWDAKATNKVCLEEDSLCILLQGQYKELCALIYKVRIMWANILHGYINLYKVRDIKCF